MPEEEEFSTSVQYIYGSAQIGCEHVLGELRVKQAVDKVRKSKMKVEILPIAQVTSISTQGIINSHLLMATVQYIHIER